MNYAHFIKEPGRGREGASDLSVEDALQLYGAMLDGACPSLNWAPSRLPARER